MSSVGLSLISAENIQNDLNQYYSLFAAPGDFDFTPLTDFALSGVNNSNVIQRELSPGNGKERTVVSTYQPRYLETDVTEGDGIEASCTCDNERGLLSQTDSIPTDGLKICEKFDIGNLSAVRERNPEWYGRGIAQMFSALRRKIESKTTTEVVAGVGSFATEDQGVTADIKTIQGWDGAPVSNGKPAPGFSASVDYSRMLVGLPRFVLFGSGNSTLYYKYTDAGCCVDTFGVDLDEITRQQQVTYIHSHRIQTSVGFNNTTDVLGVAPGAFHLAYFNLYDGDNAVDTDIFKRMAVTDPVTGMPYDMIWKIDCNDLVVELVWRGGTIFAPSDYFCTGDRLEGVNGLFQFRMTTS
jgi:hypothetical protein